MKKFFRMLGIIFCLILMIGFGSCGIWGITLGSYGIICGLVGIILSALIGWFTYNWWISIKNNSSDKNLPTS